MRPYSYIAIFSAAVLSLCGCQEELILDSKVEGISFNPFIDGVENTEVTKASAFRSEDGSIEIPAWLTVSDGIAVMPDSDPASSGIAGQARNDVNGASNDVNGASNDVNGASNDVNGAGNDVNGAGNDVNGARNDDGRHAELDSASDPSRHAELDSASPETKGTQINTGSASTALADFASSIGNTFYVTAWKGTTPERFVPSSGTNTYEAVTYSSSKWSTIETKWEGTDDNATFFAYANCPTNSSVATVSNIYSNYQTLTYSAVPTDASLQKDILLGYYYGDGDPETTDKTCTADLQFHHPLTAVRFKKGSFSGTVKFKAIYLDGVYKNGTAMMIGSGTNSSISWITTSSTKQEVCQEGDSYLTVVSDIIGDTFLLIPQTITASAPVTVTIVAEIDNVDHPLTATLAPVEWKAGKTYTYTLGYDNYELTVDGEVLMDYSATKGTKTYSVNSTAAWKLQYTTDGGTTWTDAVANTQIGGWIKFDKVSGIGSSSSQTVTATVAPATSVTTIYQNEHAANLQAAAPKGTEDAPYDLSMHTIYGDQRSAGKPVTANSYVIDAPGWYAFPLVYGNAIDWNRNSSTGVNTSAFSPSGSGTNFLSIFQSSTGSITSPYIADVTTAYPYWEDVPSYALIAQNGCTVLNQSAAEAKGLTACNCGYVVFHVNQSTLTQGNAVIAVSDGTNILWSWHIWVNDTDLTCRTVTNTSGTFSKGVLPLNLGWVDLGSSTGYPAESLQIRFVQMAGTVVKNEVGKNPKRTEYVTENPNGQSTTYQWGRKDPFIRSKADTDGTELDASEYSGTGLSASSALSSLAASIQNPAVFFYSNTGYGWASGGGNYDNLWSAGLTRNGSGEGYTAAPVKTVYDPCPPGFQVPQMDAFSSFVKPNLSEWETGFKLETYSGSGEYLFFPAPGNRNGGSPSAAMTGVDSVTRNGRYWTAAPNYTSGNEKYAYHLFVSDMVVSMDPDPYKAGLIYKTYGNSIRPVQETSGKF